MVQLLNGVYFLIVISVLASISIAHPGEHHDHHHVKAEIAKRNLLSSTSKRSLEACSGTLAARNLAKRAVARRTAKAESLRKARSLKSGKGTGSGGSQ